MEAIDGNLQVRCPRECPKPGVFCFLCNNTGWLDPEELAAWHRKRKKRTVQVVLKARQFRYTVGDGPAS